MTRRVPAFRCLLIALSLLAAACAPGKAPEELRVAVLVDPVFYQPAAAGAEASGFEYDLLAAFAESQQKRMVIVPAASPDELIALLADRDIDFAASAPIREEPAIRYSTPLREMQAVVVQRADALPADDPAKLAGRTVEVLPGTVEEAALTQLATDPKVAVERPLVADGIELLARVSDYRAELAASDSAHFDLAANYYPDLAIAQELPGKIAYAWAFRTGDDALRARADAFISEVRGDGRLARLHDRHFGHTRRIGAAGAMQLLADMRTRLPRYRRLFEQAQAGTGIDWRLLAALAYQESKWNPLATSYTGVRGMMMLTEDTADRLGVRNRLDAAESIHAGARYLVELMERLPDDVANPDRLWLALAAYNLGMGHLNGARQLAAGMKRDPNSWYEMKTVLPLLSRPKYYDRLKSGRARGGEAVIMVENVRMYYDILGRFQPVARSPLQPGLAMP